MNIKMTTRKTPKEEEEYILINNIIKIIINGEKEKYELDTNIDELVSMYDHDDICRGHFKYCIELLLKQFKSKIKGDKE